MKVPAKDGINNDCGATNGERGDLDYWSSGMTPGMHANPATNQNKLLMQLKVQSVRSVPREFEPKWDWPPCGDVPDLSVHDPLPFCKKLTGDEASYKPNGHRPKVLRGYGVPLLFEAS